MTASAIAPGIYTGTLRHRRSAPRVHDFTYRLFMVLLDIDRLPELMAISRFTGYNRWNWASFHDRDHIGDPGAPLRDRLVLDAARAGLVVPDGPVFLLTHLRYLGYCFNPVSFYYCHDREGTLRLMMADVRNTLGGRQTYWVEPQARGDDTFRGSAGKSLYVSPFMPADLTYEFRFSAPGESSVSVVTIASRAIGWRCTLPRAARGTGSTRRCSSSAARGPPRRYGAPWSVIRP